MVSIYSDRKAVVLQYDTGEYEGPIVIEMVNAADLSDIHSTELVSNQGFAAVSFPMDYSGGFHATITDSDGNVLDEGDVEV